MLDQDRLSQASVLKPDSSFSEVVSVIGFKQFNQKLNALCFSLVMFGVPDELALRCKIWFMAVGDIRLPLNRWLLSWLLWEIREMITSTMSFMIGERYRLLPDAMIEMGSRAMHFTRREKKSYRLWVLAGTISKGLEIHSIFHTVSVSLLSKTAYLMSFSLFSFVVFLLLHKASFFTYFYYWFNTVVHAGTKNHSWRRFRILDQLLHQCRVLRPHPACQLYVLAPASVPLVLSALFLPHSEQVGPVLIRSSISHLRSTPLASSSGTKDAALSLGEWSSSMKK